MAKELEEGFLEDTRWVGDVVTGDAPDKHETSDAVGMRRRLYRRYFFVLLRRSTADIDTVEGNNDR